MIPRLQISIANLNNRCESLYNRNMRLQGETKLKPESSEWKKIYESEVAKYQ